jgi:hypothetical protein
VANAGVAIEAVRGDDVRTMLAEERAYRRRSRGLRGTRRFAGLPEKR